MIPPVESGYSMKKIGLTIMLTTTILLFQILGCNSKLSTPLVPFTPTIMSLKDVYEAMPSRYENSENTILMSIEVKDIELSKQTDELLDSRRIKLAVDFKNVSSNSIVFRRPITYGFLGVNVCGNDLEIMIEMKNGTSMNITGTSNLPCGLEVSTFPKITLEDFLEIKPGDVFSYSMEVAPPGVYIKETNYVGKLPPGTYKLKAKYSNIDIGYELPSAVTPPASFDNSQAELEWYDNHTMVVDLNAWVGQILSNEVEFTIPAE